MAVRRKHRYPWEQLTDDELLDVRFCDLGISLPHTPMQERVDRLHEELVARGITFRPPCWFTLEWFSPDGVPGVGIPFYLAHERLRRIERRMMFELEGATPSECRMLLRHEAAHAVSTAFRLHYRKSWREVFGNSSQRYPTFYSPRPGSKDFVLHLDWWYAQAHPAEDFAETFSVWLRPGSRWRHDYARWPVALNKLETVDGMMREIAGQPPINRKREHVDSLAKLRYTLREHYEDMHRRYECDTPGLFDPELKRLFEENGSPRKDTAANFLRSRRQRIRATVAQWTGEHPYIVNRVLGDMIQRCRQLRLRLANSRTQTEKDTIALVTVQTMRFLKGRHRVAL